MYVYNFSVVMVNLFRKKYMLYKNFISEKKLWKLKMKYLFNQLLLFSDSKFQVFLYCEHEKNISITC